MYDNVTLKSKELYLKKFSPDDKEWKHVAKSDIDARPQSGFISQHFAAGGASSDPAPADANQSFTWQHDPYNGKVTSAQPLPLHPPSCCHHFPQAAHAHLDPPDALPGQGVGLQ